MRKRKNYKGQRIDDNIKVRRIIRPQLIDTRNLARINVAEETNVFCKVKKVESGITIKLLEKSNDERKKIVIKKPKYVSMIFVYRAFFKIGINVRTDPIICIKSLYYFFYIRYILY